MIDWWSLCYNGLWIVGLALLLATYSYGWASSSLRGATSSPFFQPGLLLLLLGGMLSSSSWLERGLWGALLALLALRAGLRRRLSTDGGGPPYDDAR